MENEGQLKGLFCGGAFSVLELLVGIWRGWIVPVGGSTPDRHKARPAQGRPRRTEKGGGN